MLNLHRIMSLLVATITWMSLLAAKAKARPECLLGDKYYAQPDYRSLNTSKFMDMNTTNMTTATWRQPVTGDLDINYLYTVEVAVGNPP